LSILLTDACSTGLESLFSALALLVRANAAFGLESGAVALTLTSEGFGAAVAGFVGSS
jgi:hypothetical protein